MPFLVVIFIFQLVFYVLLNINIIEYKCFIISCSSMMRWDLLIVMSYFEYVLKDFFCDTSLHKSRGGLGMDSIPNIPFD